MIDIMKIIISNQETEVEVFDTIYSNNIKQYRAQFVFIDNSWDEFDKIIVFDRVKNYDTPIGISINKENSDLVEIIDDKTFYCIIPWEIMTQAGYFNISILGTSINDNKEVIKKSLQINERFTVQDSGDVTVRPRIPTPNIYEQLLNRLNELNKKIEKAEGEVGRTTPEGGEIFNDYENNEANAPLSHAEGQNNICGAYGFQINQITLSGNNRAHVEVKYNSNVETYWHIGDIVQLDLNEHIYNKFKIVDFANGSSDESGSTYSSIYIVPIDEAADILSFNLALDNSDTSGFENWIWVAGKPTPYPVLQHKAAHAEGLANGAYGYAAHVEGRQNQAIGNYAHVEGRKNVATYIAHAEGQQTKAEGFWSHAEGFNSKAIGEVTHAEGQNTQAVGQRSHAEGQDTKASGEFSHAEGFKTEAKGNSSHSEGSETLANGNFSHAEGKGAETIGDNSHAEGFETKAKGQSAHAEGHKTNANGHYSHTEGVGTRTEGAGSHAEGQKTRALENYAHAEGGNTKANSTYSHAEGEFTTASGQASHAEGKSTTASGQASHAEGTNTQAVGFNSHAEGGNTQANGTYSHAEGYTTRAEGYGSHAEGGNTQANGTYSHAEGFNLNANGKYSHAEGESTTASGNASHAEGTETKASQNQAHAEGFKTEAKGFHSHAEGSETLAKGNFSHAGGKGTIASGEAQTAIGKYNEENTNALFIVGNGSDSTNRKNAFVVNKDGSATLAKGGTDDNSIVTYGAMDRYISDYFQDGITHNGQTISWDRIFTAIEKIESLVDVSTEGQ